MFWVWFTFLALVIGRGIAANIMAVLDYDREHALTGHLVIALCLTDVILPILVLVTAVTFRP